MFSSKTLTDSSFAHKAIRAVFTDLDDTLTETSRIAPKTFESLHRLKDAGVALVIVSGRPAGWADCLMRLWPLDAMIFENGAGLCVRRGEKIETLSLAPSETEENKDLLNRLFHEMKQTIPHLKLASDQHSRRFDFAVDYCEEPPHLSDQEVAFVLERLGREPAVTAKLSSIHINYWRGRHTKVDACKHWISTEGLARHVTAENIVYSGDSPNDEPLFGFFPHSVGVANVRRFLPQMKQFPQWITPSESGAGFCEMVNAVLKSRASQASK